jgi:hypothetical protein
VMAAAAVLGHGDTAAGTRRLRTTRSTGAAAAMVGALQVVLTRRIEHHPVVLTIAHIRRARRTTSSRRRSPKARRARRPAPCGPAAGGDRSGCPHTALAHGCTAESRSCRVPGHRQRPDAAADAALAVDLLGRNGSST